MAGQVSLRVSGAFTSSLIGDYVRTPRPQEGFLLGSVEHHTREQISDKQMSMKESETVISINAFQPCTRIGIFYDGTGKVDVERVKRILGQDFKRMVGWYRFRMEGDGDGNRPYRRERTIQEQLYKIVERENEHFFIALFNTRMAVVARSGTLEVSHKFYNVQNGQLVALPLNIVNIGHTSSVPYDLGPQHSVAAPSQAVQEVIGSLDGREPGIAQADSLFQGLMEPLRTLLPRLAESHQKEANLRAEVTALRSQCVARGISMNFCPTDESEENKEGREENGKREKKEKEETRKQQKTTTEERMTKKAKQAPKEEEEGREEDKGAKERNAEKDEDLMDFTEKH